MIRFLRAEFFKLRRRRMTWVLAALTVAFITLVYVALLLVVIQSEVQGGIPPDQMAEIERLLTMRNVVPFGYNLVFQLIAMFGIILAASAVGTEFGWRTIITVTAWSGDRFRLVAAKLLVLTAFVGIGVLLGFLTSLGASIVTSAIRGTLNLGEVDTSFVADAILGGLRTWFVALVYTLLAAALAMSGRNTTLGIAVGLALLFLESLFAPLLTILGDQFEAFQKFLISVNVSAVLAANGSVQGLSQPPGPDLPSPWQGAAVLAGYGFSFAALTFAVFVRRDITE